jgi:hypothetical protein
MKYCKIISPVNLVRANACCSIANTQLRLQTDVQCSCFQSTCNLRGSKGGPPQGAKAVTQLDTFVDLRLWNATLRSWGDLSVTLNQLWELVSTVLISYTFYGAVSLSTHCVSELLIAKTGCLATKKPLTKVSTGYQTSEVSHPQQYVCRPKMSCSCSSRQNIKMAQILVETTVKCLKLIWN